MPDNMRPRLQLALGNVATLAEERPALRGRRVYPAQAPGTNRPLLVTLHPAPPEGPAPELLREKLAQFAELAHPAIVLPVATGEIDGRAWVVEAEDGLKSAGARLRERGTLPVREAVRVMRDLARVLTAVHRRGLAHGALGLDTVLLAPEGTLVTGVALHEGGNAGDDLQRFFVVARSLFHGEGNDGNSLRRRLPPEIAALLDSMNATDPARRPARAESVLAVLDTFPVAEASSLGAMLDSAGRGSRSRGVPAVLRLVVLAVVGMLLLALWHYAKG